jgi:tRNA (guanine-N7-)-methyltransferase
MTEIALEIAPLTVIEWPALFGNHNPVELEIGIGKAGFLLRRAQTHPTINFVGIEWAGKFYRHAVDRLQRWNVPNARIIRTDASHFIRVQCPRGSLAALHIFHPDPWPKKRHHKRRLIQKPFVDAVVACLVPGGRWAVQTDHHDYFEQIRALLIACPELEEAPFDDPEFCIGPAGVATNYELKYRREGRPIYQIAVRRRAQRPPPVADVVDGSARVQGGRGESM